MGLTILVCVATLSSCSQATSGQVLDGANGEPVSHANVILTIQGWGWRDGSLVWDAEKKREARTDNSGNFSFPESGVSLKMKASDYGTVKTGLCGRENRVYVGGPFAGGWAYEPILIDHMGHTSPRHSEHASPVLISSSDIGVIFQESAESFPRKDINLLALPSYEVAFVAGIGNIPMPPIRGWKKQLRLTPARNCGWVLTRSQNGSLAALKIGSGVLERDLDGSVRLIMLYAQLSNSN